MSFERSGHLQHKEQPAEFRPAVRQFVSALDLLERHSNNCGIPMLTRPVRTQAQRLDALRPLLHRFRDRLRDFDAAAAFPEANFADLRAAGPLTLTIPQDLGGDGLWQADRFADYYEIVGRIDAVDSATAHLLQVHSHGASILAKHAPARQRDTYLADIVINGKHITSVGSEADYARRWWSPAAWSWTVA